MIGSLFHEVFVRPIITALVALYHLFVWLHIPSPVGFAIIVLTIIIRFILYPFISSQVRTSKKMQDLSPHLSKVREKHKGDNMKIQQETMKLYKEHGVNPAAGCLPMLIQLPVIWALYSVFQHIVRLNGKEIVSYINKEVIIPSLSLHQPWDMHFLGLPLGKGPADLLHTYGVFILLVPVITAALQFIQSKMMFASKATQPTKTKKDSSAQEDFATAFQTQSIFIFPLMIGFFSYSFPIGLSLYWNTFTIFGILQQYKIAGLGGLAQYSYLWNKKNKK
jgi:YidC/Oxa1 family membrane protein insertase